MCLIQTVSFGHRLAHIKVQHLVLDSTTLECNTWSRVEPHYHCRIDCNTSHVKSYKILCGTPIMSVRVKAKLFEIVKFFCAVPQGLDLRVFSLYRKWSLIKYFWLLQGRPIDACRTPQKDPLRHTLTLHTLLNLK